MLLVQRLISGMKSSLKHKAIRLNKFTDAVFVCWCLVGAGKTTSGRNEPKPNTQLESGGSIKSTDRDVT